jgi:cobalt-zinc-cadmium efflux system outer membrane protein
MLSPSRALAWVLVVASTASTSSTRADPAAPIETLDEATFVARALSRSPRRATYAARRSVANTEARAVAVRPNLSFSYDREAVPGLSTDDFVRVGWVIDVAGRRDLAIAAANAGANAERLDVDREAFVFAIDAQLAYLDAVYAHAQLARLDDARRDLVELVAALRSRSRQGEASGYDADRVALELDGLDDERAGMRRAVELAQLRLGAVLGEPDAAYAPSGVLALPSLPPPAASPRRPDIDAARARADRADHEAAAARRTWIPRLNLAAGVVLSSSTNGNGLGYLVSLGGDLPVFNRGGGATERARAEATRWRSEAAALAHEVRSEVIQARRELELRIDQAASYAAGVAARVLDLQRRTLVAYREGDRTILEMLDAQRAARTATLRVVELTYEARRAALKLVRAEGSAP